MKYISRKSMAKTLTTGFIISLTAIGTMEVVDTNVAYASTVSSNYRRVTKSTTIYSHQGYGSVLGTAQADSIITLIEVNSGTWVKIYDSSKGITGYINRMNLAYTDRTPSTSTTNLGYRRVARSTTIYSHQGYGSVLGTAQIDSIITLLEVNSGSWVKIYDNSKGVSGYVNRMNLAYTDRTPSSNTTTSKPSTGTTTSTPATSTTPSTPATSTTNLGYRKVNRSSFIYSGPGTGYKLGNTTTNSIITLLEVNSSAWVKIYDNVTGVSGYIDRNTLGYTNQTPQSNPSTSTVIGYRKVNTSTSIYSGEGTGSWLGTARAGSLVSLYYANGTWAKVYDHTTGITGFVNRNCLGYTTETPQNDKVEKVISLAKQQLGKRYVYGAEGPNTFDCSGLTYYTFKNSIGMTIPRTSSQQAKIGTKVSLSELKRGDLVIFGNKSTGSVNHVAIYLGNNEYIHSPQTGDVVKITKTSSSHFRNKAMYGRRVL